MNTDFCDTTAWWRGGAARLFWHDEEAVAEGPNDPRIGEHGFLRVVLMPVEEESRLRSHDVGVEGGEADVNLVVAVMDQPGRVVCHEDIHWGERVQVVLDFVLLEQVIALGLVFPRAAKAAKCYTAELKGGQVEVADGGTKWRAGVMVAFHGDDFTTGALGGDTEDDVVRQVAAADEQVGVGFGDLSAYEFIVCNDQQVHWDGMVGQHCGGGN